MVSGNIFFAVGQKNCLRNIFTYIGTSYYKKMQLKKTLPDMFVVNKLLNVGKFVIIANELKFKGRVKEYKKTATTTKATTTT